jgi:hypothetical protein
MAAYASAQASGVARDEASGIIVRRSVAQAAQRDQIEQEFSPDALVRQVMHFLCPPFAAPLADVAFAFEDTSPLITPLRRQQIALIGLAPLCGLALSINGTPQTVLNAPFLVQRGYGFVPHRWQHADLVVRDGVSYGPPATQTLVRVLDATTSDSARAQLGLLVSTVPWRGGV